MKQRLERELERGPLPSKDRGDTSALGGWAKIGKDLESLASGLFDELAATCGVDPAGAKREYGVFRKPTIGQWLEAVIDLGRVAAKHGELSAIAKFLLTDLKKDKMSVLSALADVRNPLQHDVADRPSAQEATRALSSALELLSRLPA